MVGFRSFTQKSPLSLKMRATNMVAHSLSLLLKFDLVQLFFILSFLVKNSFEDILGCGGFLKSDVSIDFSKVEVRLYTRQGTLKESSDCAPTNGYYFIPIYDKGEYLLKIEPPTGWFFEPKEVYLNFDGTNDPCSKSSDINFMFKGFTINGKVNSAGSSEGPENVIVNLASETDGKADFSTTSKNGYFQFTPIVPGKYIITAKHDKYRFSKDLIRVTVKAENLEVPANSLVVAGYDITGQVLFNREPTKGVNFVLSAADNKKLNIKPTECSTAPLNNYKYKDYICHVLSDDKGVFQMKTVPPGAYVIRPHYVKFDVKPEEINVVVKHSHVTLSEKFLVKGFSVGGQVLASPGGPGISRVQLYLNGEKVAMTDKEGRYNLDSMEPGSYVLSVQSEDMKFEEVTVKVSPNTPEIATIYPSEFKVCGRVTPSMREPPRAVEIVREGGETVEAIVAPDSGRFCKFLKPGTYTLRVKMSDLEKSTGMLYLPLTKTVHVRNGPITDVDFTQLRGNISGKVVKLPEAGKANEVSVKLKLNNALVALKVLEGHELSYSFQEIMPGYYDVELENDRWCFQNQVHSISVTTSETKVPDFLQTGFKIKIVSSHDTPALITKDTPGEEFKRELKLQGGENVICLPHASAYRLQPVGCHGFAKDVYEVDARGGGSMKLNAVLHDVTGFVRSSSLEGDVMVEVVVSGGETAKLGPLNGEKDGSGYRYDFKYRTKGNEMLKFTPTSSQLLFQPETIEFRTVNNCSKDAIRFVGEKGLIVEGRVDPPLENVRVVLTSINDSTREDVVLITKADGKYKFGPLKKTWKFEITAEKESYVLSGPDSDGIFKAHKLAEINVKVMDNSTREPLQGVLLSLTGGEKFRKNSMTGKGGLLSFHSLSPGEYFLRPMMKEYKFEPSSQIIHIKEGVTESIELRGRRVSFSAYGLVTSLNGEPEASVMIEATGMNTCSNLQEEASSESNGQFRIRGLLPQCEYLIRLKSGADVNTHIHRLAPQDLIIRTNEGDIRNIELVAFHLLEQMDISIHVESTVPEHLKTLRVKLCRDNAPDSPLHVVKLDTLAGGAKHWGSPVAQERFLKAGLLVQLPFIPRDKTPYFIQLESTLNKHMYTYKEPVVHFIADRTYRNFKMTFEPVMKVLDHELTQSNYILVPLLIFAGLAYTYSHKLVPAVQNLLGTLNQNSFSLSSREERNLYSHNAMSESMSIEPVGQTTNKRKAKPRKA